MIDLDRLFVAGAVQRGILDPVQLAPVLDEWSQQSEKLLVELLVERRLVEAHETESFLRMARNFLEADPRVASERLELLTAHAVANALPKITDPVIRDFLQAEKESSGRPGRLAETSSYYRLLRKRGQGGTGRIWLAEEPSLDRHVALKELRPDRQNNAAVRRRFIREAQILGQLQHPGIVPLYRLEHQEDRGDLFYTMRLLKGRTLEESTFEFHSTANNERFRSLAFNQLLSSFVSACQAVSFAHSHGVIHRDLKPANIMLGDFGEAIVLDWGLAKRLHADHEPTGEEVNLQDSAFEDAGLTMDGSILGTPQFMAPEQAAGRNADIGPATDVYALGGVLFNILTGAAPHPARLDWSKQQYLEHIAGADPPSVATVEPRAPAALAAIATKAMAKLPQDRYHSVGELIDDVRRWMAGEPVSVFPESRFRRLVRWIVRHQVGVALAGSFLFLALIAGTVLVGFGVASALHIIEVEKEEVSDVAANLSSEMQFMLILRAENTRYMGQLAEVVGTLAPLQADLERQRQRAVRTLSTFLDTRRERHVFSILDNKLRQERVRVAGPIVGADGSRRVEVDGRPGMTAAEIDDILSNVAKLDPLKVYVPPIRPPLRDGNVIEREPPISRNCASIISEAGEFLGAFVNESPALPALKDVIRQPEGQAARTSTFITATDGRLLYYYLADDSGIEAPLAEDTRLVDLFPEVAPLYESSAGPRRSLKVAKTENLDQLLYAERIVMDHWKPEQAFVNITTMSRRQIIDAVESRMALMALSTVFALAVCVAGIAIAVRFFARVASASIQR